MIGPGLKKLAQEYRLQVAGGVAYGDMEGYTVTVFEGMGVKTLGVSAVFPDEGARGSLYMELNDPQRRKGYRIQGVGYDEREIIISFMDNPGTMKCIREFIGWFMPRLSRSGALGVSHCPLCGQPLEGQYGAVRKINSVAHRVHASCASELEQRVAQERDAHREQPKNYSLGAVGALLGAVVGAIPWAIVYSFGWFVAYLGLLIGFAAKKGYELLGGKPGKGKFWIILPATLVGVVLGNFAGDIISIFKMIAAGEIPGATYGDIPAIFAFIIGNDGEYLRSALISIGLGCFFALLGIIGILREIRAENQRAVTVVEELE